MSISNASTKIAGQLARSDASLFDKDFYRSKYFNGRNVWNVSLSAHFFCMRILAVLGFKPVHGTERDFISSFRDTLGELPDGFDVEYYLAAHPDLRSAFRFGWQAKLHYLEHGRREGRKYKRFNVLESKSSRPSTANSLPFDERFKVAEFITLNPSIAVGVETKEEAVKAFVDRGIDKLAPIALDSIFDSTFYREYYNDLSGSSAVEAYRHWLYFGIKEGRVGSEADLLQRKLIGSALFPAAFDWETYLKRLGPRAPTRRWAAFEHLLTRGFKEGREAPTIAGEDKGYFFEKIADFFWGRRDGDAARKALTLCFESAPDDGRLHHKMGDYLKESGLREEAAAFYSRALSLGYRNMWTYLHLVDDALMRSDFECAYHYLAESRPQFAGQMPWRAVLDDAIWRHYHFATAEARSLFRMDRREEGEARYFESLDRIARAISELDDLPPPLRCDSTGHVVMFSMTTVPQCRHYRVTQRLQQFEKLGVEVRCFSGDQPIESLGALAGATALIVYREPASPHVMRLILHAKALGIRTFYEIDDLVFDSAHYPEPLEHYGSQVGFDEYIELLCGVVLYRTAMSLCDEGITSTARLARHMEAVVAHRLCHVIPNGLDSRNDVFTRSPPSNYLTKNELFIFYGSGTRTHNRNFNECVAPALSKIMDRRPFVKLVIVGFLDLDPILARHSERIVRSEFCDDIAAYWALLASMHINIAVLTPGEMNDCKSEIKWLEAAAAGVPSVVSATATYRATLHDGEDVLLVPSIEDWEDALLRLIDDVPLREKIGTQARRRAKEYFSLDANVSRLSQMLGRLPNGAALRPTDERMRLLLVNVFFPPQTYGGATRVVRDIVDDLERRCEKDISVAVYATDFGETAGRARVGGYGSVPVFRYAPDLGPGADVVVENSAVETNFGDVLDAWRPDVVHVHCVQYLSASILIACRNRRIPYIVTAHDGWWLSRYQFLVDEFGFLRLPCDAVKHDIEDSACGDLLRRHRLAELMRGAFAVTSVSNAFGVIYSEALRIPVITTENGLPPSFSGQRRAKTASGRKRVRVGHIGGLDIQKGAFLFEAALRRGHFRNIEAIVIDHDKEESHLLQTQWGDTEIKIKGKVDPARIESLYEEIDVLVAPSIWPESYGLVTREALARGVWVVASDLGAIGDDIVEDVNGFKVDVRNSEGLSTILKRINGSPRKYMESPSRAYSPRLISELTDELCSLYRAARSAKAEASMENIG